MSGARCEPAVREMVLQATRAPVRCLGAGLLCEPAWIAIAHSLGLSHRELQIVRGVFDDATEHAIAAGLGSSPHTVHTHFERLHHKLGVQTRAQIILRVFQEFLALSLCPGGKLDPICGTWASGNCPLHAGSSNPVRLPAIG